MNRKLNNKSVVEKTISLHGPYSKRVTVPHI